MKASSNAVRTDLKFHMLRKGRLLFLPVSRDDTALASQCAPASQFCSLAEHAVGRRPGGTSRCGARRRTGRGANLHSSTLGCLAFEERRAENIPSVTM